MTTPETNASDNMTHESAAPGGSANPNGNAPPPKTAPRWWAILQRMRGLGSLLAVLLAFSAGLWLAPNSEHGHRQAAGSTKTGTVWTCSMHPQIRLPEPGPCPICGMALIPLEPGGQAEHDARTVSLTPAAAKLAELRTTPVTRGKSSAEIRLLGRLAYDETAVRTITAWVGGRIDRLYVSSMGATIGAGQPIAELYSPEVYAAHQDLILAKKQVERMQGGLPVALTAAEAALGSARQRLKLLGIDDATLSTMAQAESPSEHVKIHSPFGGTVLEQMVNQGAYVTTGTPLYRVAALGRIWVQLDAYETDLARIRLKDTVTIEIASLPGEQFAGKVTFIDPIVNPESRTARVRIEVANKKGRLSPGMFAQAVIHNKDRQKTDDQVEAPLLVPDSAVLFTGERSVVFVEVASDDKPSYQARQVQLGPRTGDVYPVVAGLSEGERVVSAGAFALDAELQIQGGSSMMTLPDDLMRARSRAFDVPPAELAKLTPVVEAALSLHVALSKDDLEGSREAFSSIEAKSSKLQLKLEPSARARLRELLDSLATNAAQGKRAKDLDVARQHYHTLSTLLIELVRRFGNPLANSVRLAFCPMAMQGKGAEWLQAAESVENPYFGKKMYDCGEIRAAAPARGRLPMPTPDRAAPKEHHH